MRGPDRELVSKISIAVVLGIFTDASIVIFLKHDLIVLWPILVLPFLGWFFLTSLMVKQRWIPPLPAFAIFFLVIFGIPLAANLPFKLAELEVQRRAADTPFPVTTFIERERWFLGDGRFTTEIVFDLKLKPGFHIGDFNTEMESFPAKLDRSGWSLASWWTKDQRSRQELPPVLPATGGWCMKFCKGERECFSLCTQNHHLETNFFLSAVIRNITPLSLFYIHIAIGVVLVRSLRRKTRNHSN